MKKKSRNRNSRPGMINSLVHSHVLRRRIALLATEYLLIQVLDRAALHLIQRSQMRRREKFFQDKYLN